MPTGQSQVLLLVTLINLYGGSGDRLYILCMTIDDLDRRLVTLLSAEPRIGVLEASRRLRVARGTVQARLDRLVSRGIIKDFAPSLDPAALGWGVTAFATVEISQGAGRADVIEHLAAIPEVLEVHTITGQGDLLCRIVGRSNEDLQRVIDDVVATTGIQRTSTVIALATVVPYRVLPLVTHGGTSAHPPRNLET
jgi:DNA-binding Lrp family transcriptional regulator